jgi:hypothetical protein
MAYENVLRTYNNHNIYEGTEFDKDSIMLYYLPDAWMEDGHENPTKPNYVLSIRDIEWLQKIYPLDSISYPTLIISFVDKLSPVWKRAWVEKIVIETFTPIIGIKFVFPPLQESKCGYIAYFFRSIGKTCWNSIGSFLGLFHKSKNRQ